MISRNTYCAVCYRFINSSPRQFIAVTFHVDPPLIFTRHIFATECDIAAALKKRLVNCAGIDNY